VEQRELAFLLSAFFKPNEILFPVHLIPAQFKDFATAHSQVISNDENQPLMIWELATKCEILLVFEKALAYVVLFQHFDLRGGVNERRRRARAERVATAQCFEPAIDRRVRSQRPASAR
jgi:hypothetical protein